MWASDYTVSRERANWGEALSSVRRCSSLSQDKKSWILGRTARKVLNWPVPEEPRKRAPLHPHQLGLEQ